MRMMEEYSKLIEWAIRRKHKEKQSYGVQTLGENREVVLIEGR